MKTEKTKRLIRDHPTSDTCKHGRMVDYEYMKDELQTDRLRCLECGEVFPDPKTDAT